MEAIGGGAVYYERGTSVRLAFCAGNARRPHPETSSAAALCRQEEARSPIYSAKCIPPLNKRETWGPSERDCVRVAHASVVEPGTGFRV